MRNWLLIVAALAVGGVANADPLEQAALQQVTAQAPGSVQVAPYFHGGPGEKTDWQILLDSSKCYWFSGTSSGTKKLALFLWPPNSNMFTPRLTSERSESGQVTMAWCPKASGMHKFQAKIEGKGPYVVGVFAKDAPKQEAPTTPVVAAPAGVDLGAICDKAAAAAAQGARRNGAFLQGGGSGTGHDDRADYTLQFEAGKCYWVISCGEPDHIKKLSMYLWGPNNKRITETKGDSATAMVGHCPQITGMFKVQTKVTSGSGAWNVGVYVK
jgi:hypothetical protein